MTSSMPDPSTIARRWVLATFAWMVFASSTVDAAIPRRAVLDASPVYHPPGLVMDSGGDTTPPMISSVMAGGITADSTAISWWTNEGSDSQVAYGPTAAYGNLTPRQSGMDMSHGVFLGALTPGTAYHFAVLSRDAAGNLATSDDYAFTTSGDTTPPAITAVATGGISAGTASVTWTTDEASDSQVAYGQTIAYGSTTVSDPTMVMSHHAIINGMSAGIQYHFAVLSRDASGNLATSNDATFMTGIDITAPVITAVTVGAITPGSAVVGWSTDEASDSQVAYGVTTAYGGLTVIDGGRVTTHAVTVTGLAMNTLYHFRVLGRDAAGNLATGDDGTFTTGADTTAPVIAGISAGSISVTATLVAWTTDEASDSQVEYGTTIAYGNATIVAGGMVLAHGVPITGLELNTLYHFCVLSKDPAGNLAISDDGTFVTGADTTLPVITAITVGDVTVTSAAISWTTDEAGDSQVAYGLTAAYGSVSMPDAAMVLAHRVPLGGLAVDSQYHFAVLSRDAAGNLATSADDTFRTGAGSGSGDTSSGSTGGCGLGGTFALVTMLLVLSVRMHIARTGSRPRT